jgi:hypothetical protein
MKAGSLFSAHKVRRSAAHLFRRPAESAPIESVTRDVQVRDVQLVMTGKVPRVRMASRDRTVALSLPRVKWAERDR